MKDQREIQNYIQKELSKILCQHEIAIYQARQTRMKTKIQRYFNSTPLRNVFARIVVYANCVNKHYSIQYIADELKTTRQSISKIVEECEAEGWINVIRTPNSVDVQANHVLYQGMLYYVEQRKKLMPKEMRQTWNELLALQTLVESDVTLNDATSVKLDDVVVEFKADTVNNNGVQSGIKQKTN
tara:strand:- start:4 stop:558 length:555 start_codon:yes stop_codon:yes gene_type:complete